MELMARLQVGHLPNPILEPHRVPGRSRLLGRPVLVSELHHLNLEGDTGRGEAQHVGGGIVPRNGGDARVEVLTCDRHGERPAPAGERVDLTGDDEGGWPGAPRRDGPPSDVHPFTPGPAAAGKLSALQVRTSPERPIAGVVGVELDPAPEASQLVGAADCRVVAVCGDPDLPQRLVAVRASGRARGHDSRERQHAGDRCKPYQSPYHGRLPLGYQPLPDLPWSPPRRTSEKCQAITPAVAAQ